MSDINSQWFPYTKVHEAYYDLSESKDIPRKICDYLIDAPQAGYVPADDNRFSRCRFWKYLYYDSMKPLAEPLPSIQEKLSVLYNPERSNDPPTDKGYRLIPQIYVKESQENAQTRVHVYMGRTIANSEYKMAISVVFMIWTHYTYELNTKQDEYSRAFAIEQALIEAFHGVNMDGVGTFYMSKSAHPDCGSRAIFDGNTNVGRELTLALEIATTQLPQAGNFSNSNGYW